MPILYQMPTKHFAHNNYLRTTCTNEVTMNIKHKDCELRRKAKEARKRLINNAYNPDEIGAPRDISPAQRTIYLKLLSLKREGKQNINPIEQFADKEKLSSLPYEDRQRYIMQICADYLEMKNEVEKRINQ